MPIATSRTLSTEKVAEQYLAAYFSRDLEKLASFYTEKSVYTDPTAESMGVTVHFKGRDDIIKNLKKVYPAEAKLQFKRELVFSTGEYFVAAGVISYDLPSSGGKDQPATRLSGKAVIVLQVEGGKVVLQKDYADYDSIAKSMMKIIEARKKDK